MRRKKNEVKIVNIKDPTGTLKIHYKYLNREERNVPMYVATHQPGEKKKERMHNHLLAGEK